MRSLLTENPILAARAGRELQILWLDRLAWLQWVALGPRKITVKASERRGFRKSFWRDVRKRGYNLFENLLRREQPPAPRPADEAGEEAFSAWLHDYLSNDWNAVYAEAGQAGTIIGYLSGYMSGNLKLPPERVQDLSLDDYDRALRYQLGVSLDDPGEIASAVNGGGGRGGLSVPGMADDDFDGFADERAAAIHYARENSAQWIAVYDDNGERSGPAYESIMRLYRRQVSEALEKGETLEQLRSRIVFPDLLALLERGEISEDDYLEWSVKHLNRDFQRVAQTEASIAWNNGRLLHKTDQTRRFGTAQYVRFDYGIGAAL